MRIRALTIRILSQLVRDKRTMAIILVAPIIILSLIYFILDTSTTTYNIAVINAPKEFINELNTVDNIDFSIQNLSKNEAISKIENKDITAAVGMDDNYKNISIYIDGADNTSSMKIQAAIKNAVMIAMQNQSKEQINDTKNQIQKLTDT